MADEQTPPENTQEPVPLAVDMRFVDELPGGRAVMPVEHEGGFVWLVVKGHVSPQARGEMVDDLNHIVRSGLWRQDWRPPRPCS